MLVSHGLSHYLKTHYADRTFRTAYRWNSFDIGLLIPYFLVMLVLATYGLHRYQLVWLYYRNRRRETRSDAPYARFAEPDLPFVTIQLPIFNEQFVIDRPPSRPSPSITSTAPTATAIRPVRSKKA